MLEATTRAGFVVTGGSILSSAVLKAVDSDPKVFITATVVSLVSVAATLACGLSAARIRTAHFGKASDNMQPISDVVDVPIEADNRMYTEEA